MTPIAALRVTRGTRSSSCGRAATSARPTPHGSSSTLPSAVAGTSARGGSPARTAQSSTCSSSPSALGWQGSRTGLLSSGRPATELRVLDEADADEEVEPGDARLARLIGQLDRAAVLAGQQGRAVAEAAGEHLVVLGSALRLARDVLDAEAE